MYDDRLILQDCPDVPLSLLQTVYANAPDLLDRLETFIQAGERLDDITEYGESPLRVASCNGRFDAVRRLLEVGAAEYQFEWTDTAHLVVFGSLADLETHLSRTSCSELEVRDIWERTPFLLAVMTGDIARVELLLRYGADRTAVGRCGKTALQHAARANQLEMLEWLVRQGFDLEATDDFDDTALAFAVKHGEAQAARKLLALGARIPPQTEGDFIWHAASVEIAKLLAEYGEDISRVSGEVHAELVGTQYHGLPEGTRDSYLAARFREFGRHNPEETCKPHWLAMIRSGDTVWQADELFRADAGGEQPKWCYDRFGRSTTLMPDGRIIEVGGEHEDYYDPDFCIYNDVVVFDGKGGIRIFSYPEEVFPPTDFHTATLIGEQIYLIGSLGYSKDRHPGYTPVYRLDTRTMQIECLTTTGEMPGWINRHRARFVEGQGILVSGGKVIAPELPDDQNYLSNSGIYCLNPTNLVWRKIGSAD